MNYYNELDKYCCQWLQNLMEAGIIPTGHVDSRPIQEVTPADVAGYTQCHFFAGLGGWPYAARLAGWPDARPLWTGSCPCQPFSCAGRRQGVKDPRHLWPDFHRLISASRPPVVMGEQVAGKDGRAWFDGVASDLETDDYATRAVDIPACAVDAPHIRNRLYWITERGSVRRSQCWNEWLTRGVVDSETSERWGAGTAEYGGRGAAKARRSGYWDRYVLVGPGRDGKYRRLGLERVADSAHGVNQQGGAQCHERDVQDGSGESNGGDGARHPRVGYVESPIPLVVAGIPARVSKLRAIGNAINPVLAAEVIRAYMEGERAT